ncbi:MAG: HNH endonuclease signature motif containing protein [Ornithinibacter sp.]
MSKMAGHRPAGKALPTVVRARDVHCRFPGCSVPAKRRHVDHVVAFPTGHTVEANLHALCPAHHGFTHHAGRTLTMTPEGVCTWTAPDRRAHAIQPGAHHDPAP